MMAIERKQTASSPYVAARMTGVPARDVKPP
jgi:hypothetical protein